VLARRPPFVVAIARLRFRLAALRARSAAESQRGSVIVRALVAIATIVIAIARVVSPSVEHGTSSALYNASVGAYPTDLNGFCFGNPVRT